MFCSLLLSILSEKLRSESTFYYTVPVSGVYSPEISGGKKALFTFCQTPAARKTYGFCPQF